MAGDEEAGTEAGGDGGPSRTAILISVAGLLAIVALVLLVNPLRNAIGDAISGDTESLREDLRGLGFGGVMLVVGLAIAHAVVWYPAEILNAAAGFIYGFWPAFVLLMFAWLGNGLVCFFVGRHAARPGLVRFLGRSRFERFERVIQDGGATLLLAMRLIPIVPFSFFSYVAGSARVPLWTFVWTTMIGYIPITALFIYLGSRLEELSPTDPFIWIGAAALIAMLLVTRWVLPRFTSNESV